MARKTFRQEQKFRKSLQCSNKNSLFHTNEGKVPFHKELLIKLTRKSIHNKSKNPFFTLTHTHTQMELTLKDNCMLKSLSVSLEVGVCRQTWIESQV